MVRYGKTNLVGEFQHINGTSFTYARTTNEWAISQGLEFEIDVSAAPGCYDVRFANITKTRVYVAVDEDQFGKAILEKWNIKNHNVYGA